MHENRETSRSAMSDRKGANSPAGEGQGRTTRTYDREESDSVVIPMKSPNKARSPMGASAAEVMEGRAGTKENCDCARTCRTLSRIPRFHVSRAMRWPPTLAARVNIQGKSHMR
ncbi:MAG: hypothetical protein JWQ87_3087 [Candidatus Sulfotelmatobacter sp.]|nr:hypothetical protein [Candidatus Sulfotelmatobacter sp.]